jgi:hypothetical protein
VNFSSFFIFLFFIFIFIFFLGVSATYITKGKLFETPNPQNDDNQEENKSEKIDRNKHKLEKIDYALKVLGKDRKSALHIIKNKKSSQPLVNSNVDPSNSKRKLPQKVKSEINKKKKEKKDERRKRRRESRQKQKEEKEKAFKKPKSKK